MLIFNRKAIILSLKTEQESIEFESDDDEGAAEYWGDVESLIKVLDNPLATNEEIVDAANWVGLNGFLGKTSVRK